jgi:hypothetical protein
LSPAEQIRGNCDEEKPPRQTGCDAMGAHQTTPLIEKIGKIFWRQKP